MNCRSARRLLEFARPGVPELDACDLAALERHLAECPVCQSLHQNEQRGDGRLAAAMQAVPVPTDGKLAVVARLKSARRAWWRSRLLGAAASILGLILLVSLFDRFWGRPVFDPMAVAQSTYEQSGQFRSAEEARQIVNAWFRGIDRRLAAPAEWNYRFLAFFGRADFEGLSSVPVMVLTRGDAVARLYVVRETSFRNLDAVNSHVEEGGSVVAVRRYPECPGWVVIAVVTGAPIDAFLRASPTRDPA